MISITKNQIYETACETIKESTGFHYEGILEHDPTYFCRHRGLWLALQMKC